MPISKTFRLTIYVITGLAIIFVIAGISLHVYAKQKIIETLKTQLTKSTNGEYELSLSRLSLNFFTQNLTAHNISILRSKKIVTDLKAEYTLNVKTIRLIDFSILSYLKKDGIVIDALLFEGIQIMIFQENGNLIKKKEAKRNKAPGDLFKKLNSISIGSIEMPSAKILVYRNRTDTTPVFLARQIDVKIDNFFSEAKEIKLFKTNKFEVTLNNFNYNVATDGLYTFFGKRLVASLNDSTLVVEDLKLVPNYGKKEFFKKTGKQSGRVEIVTSKINLSKVDYKLFLESKKLVIHKVNIAGCAIDIYRDNTLPLAPIEKPSLQAMVKNLPFSLSVDSILMKNYKVNFEVQNPGENSTGKLFVTRMNTIITKVINDTTLFNNEHCIEAVADGYFLDQGKFNLNYSFSLRSTGEFFYCWGNLSSMSMVPLNSIIKQAKDMSIKSGQLDTASFTMIANENSAEGTLSFKYHNLNVDLLNDQNQKKGQGAKFKSFILNRFIVYDSNPGKKGILRLTKISMRHDPYRYFLNYTAQSILSGVGPAIVGEKNKKYFQEKK